MSDFTRYVFGVEPGFINLDNAASTPPFKSVAKAVNDFLPSYSSVHRGSGIKSRISTELYEQARRCVGDFVGASESEHTVIFGKNTTEAINKLSYRLGLVKRDIVLILHLEHHSNDLPWRRTATVKRIGLTPNGQINKEDFKRPLALYKARIKLVAISGASNVTGHIPDIHWFAKEAHGVGARILVDCAQLAAHRAIRMSSLNDPEHLDYIALSAHKMYAPFGMGALIGRKDAFANGAPEYRGGGTISFVAPHTVDWANLPDKDEAGSPNVVGAVAFASAIKTMQQIGMQNIAEHEAALTSYALSQLKTLPSVTIYGDTDPANAKNRSGVIPFTLGRKPANLVAAILGYEFGIGVRSGCFCAQPYVMQLLGLGNGEVSEVRSKVLSNQRGAMPGLVRISFGLYNTKKDIDAVVNALRQIAAGKYGEYKLDRATGSYTPVGAS